jgi:hypothetical protein
MTCISRNERKWVGIPYKRDGIAIQIVHKRNRKKKKKQKKQKQKQSAIENIEWPR